MNNALTLYLQQVAVWHKTDKAEFPYITEINGEIWKIRLNDFPEQALYTLIVQEMEIGDFDDWPSQWQR